MRTNIRLSQVPSVNPNAQPGLSGAIAVDDDRLPRTRS